MQKKSTKKKPPAKSLQARAKAIVDSDAYDQDTRQSIRFMLQTKDTDLPDMVARAEQGETVCDTLRLQADHKKAARQVLALLDSEIVPIWLREAVEDAIVEAGRRRIGVNPYFTPVRRAFAGDGTLTGRWLGVDKNPAVPAILANLFRVTHGDTYSLHLSDQERLAAAISEILNNDLTPPRLHNVVGDFVTDVSTALLDDSPEMIGKALQLGQCGYGRCPGTKNGTPCAGPDAHPSDKPAKRRARAVAVPVG